MTTPDEELERPYAYTIAWQDEECDDACFCSGWLLASSGGTLEVYSLSAARMAVEDVIDLPEYSRCRFSIYRRPRELTKVEEHISFGEGRGAHFR